MRQRIVNKNPRVHQLGANAGCCNGPGELRSPFRRHPDHAADDAERGRYQATWPDSRIGRGIRPADEEAGDSDE